MAIKINDLRTLRATPFAVRLATVPPPGPARDQGATADPRLLVMRSEDAARRQKRMARRARKLQRG